ncbi:DsbA family oxidoreductase [Acinetobacter shaoyimingii]|uniref:Disulfide bond formation protein DsbA n=1 Tax=Acinetobacter shaoyimingii TaxID=2715164 RepID=A0A6G8RU87_9GAMM|nr:DsbA family protein [Acinetobacter shaoyimingii]QIO05451.1 disulfide bond formation protein DsbA [Acinetobacter shaoyimingii]
MKIQFVFDIAYPMSYVAFQKLKKNWDQQLNHHIELIPVQMVPEISDEGLNIMRYLSQKYGSTEAQRKLQMTKFIAYSEDLEIDIEHMKRMPNSQLAHQAILALDHTLDRFALTQAIFNALFKHGQDIANPAVLKSIIDGIGLDGQHVLRSIQHKEIADQQQEHLRYIEQFRQHPIPYLIIDGQVDDENFILMNIEPRLRDAC